ncbi:hypothetical protein C100_08995 [Sphingobium sp. C100]|uniref:filamentous hemagglutinin N-terminal domain-containing protein n=1 Tax=Sphingobium sp. C100 TaxID=1207055 RepID=UPI0003D631D6|nr:filamentous hemagglutinin N-terminal domain-containing protein [Sphingobium sp. C100]ETI64127.1 hypothetical protein C100_08995 [Sphingobium sp. C100]
MTATNRNRRNRLLIGASLAALTVIGAGNAHAQNLGERRPVDPAVAAAQASQNAASRNAQAEAAAQRTRASFEAASRARAQMDAAQNAAREAARLAQTSIPNGLGKGGLQPSADITIDPSLWVGAKGPTQSQGTNGRTNVAVDQIQEKAILTWETFNVGRETDLTFNQQGNKNWIALNRVSDPGANPTQILGSIKADGSVYIINPNGVIFGGASQVNVRSLIASSLDINAATLEARNQRFLDGLVPGTQYPPATFSDGAIDAGPIDVFERGDGVTVEAGARINVAPLGQAVLIGHAVTNHGSIIASNGQVVLAAGREVYLEDGLKRAALSEGDPTEAIRGLAVITENGGQVQNSGLIETKRGNITLTGKSIFQNGVLAATTAIDANGSIILNASYGKVSDPRVIVGSPFYRGDVVFGSESFVSILPDDSGKAQAGNSFRPSQIEVHAHNIMFEDNSTLYAPGARVYLLSSTGTFNGEGSDAEPGRLYVGKGAALDVSGLNGVEIDMAQNEIKANLTANELADNPVLRDSALRGETVYFDARLGEKLTDGTGVANLSGWYDLIERPVEQFMTTGGSITMKGAEIIAREGSTIDLSGGSVLYNSGYVKSTNLVDAYGRIVPIEQAMAGVAYAGVEGDFIVSHARWGVTERFTTAFSRIRSGAWYDGYVEGRSAGTLNVQTITNPDDRFYRGQAPDHARIFDGEVRAGVITGAYQVDKPAGASITDVGQIWRERPALGTLNWSGNFLLEPTGGNITIAGTGPRITSDFSSDTELFDYSANAASLVDGIVAHDHVLPTNWFDGETFGSVSLYSGDAVQASYAKDAEGNLVRREDVPPTGGVLTIGEGVTVDLGAHGTFRFTGRQANLDGSILAPGGSVSLVAAWTPKLTGSTNATLDETPLTLRPSVHLGSTGVIDVAGRWSNNWLEALSGVTLTAPVINGGSVSIVGYKIALDEGSLIDVSGGAHLATDGKTLTLGDGGSILLDISEPTLSGATSSIARGELALNGGLIGTAPGKGGTLIIDTPWDLVIGEDWGDLAAIAGGVLEAGTAAPKDVVLTGDLVVPAGQPLPVDALYTSGTIPPDVAVASDSSLNFFDFGNPIIVAADWTVPAGFPAIYDTGWNYFGPGSMVPAGTQIGQISGSIRAGTKIPASAFPDGIATADSQIKLTVTKGTVLENDFSIPSGTTLAKGTVLQQDASVDNDLKLVTADYFRGGGGAAVADQWGDFAAIADGVLEAGTPAPTRIRTTDSFTVAPGQPLPLDSTYASDTLPAGVKVPGSTYISFSSCGADCGNDPVTVGADWPLPNRQFTAIATDGSVYRRGAVVPAGTVLNFISGTLDSGAELPADVFPNGLRLANPVMLTAVAGSRIDVAITFGAGLFFDAGTILDSDISVAFPQRLAGSTFSQEGFANFSLSGSRGITIQPGTVIEPAADTLALAGTVRDLASGTDLRTVAQSPNTGVTLVNSADLPESLRQTTDLTLSTFILDYGDRRSSGFGINPPTLTDHPGSFVMGEGAEIRLTPGSRVVLDSLANLSIDGTISTPGGSISLAVARESAQIRLGSAARLLAPGYVETLLTDGYEQRFVHAGGTINIGLPLQGGNNVANSVQIDPYAVLDVSGVHGFADVAPGDAGRSLNMRAQSPFTSVEVDGDAGSIAIAAASGLIAGDLRLAPGGTRGRGGNLTVTNSTNRGAAGILVRQSYDAEAEPASHLTLIADSVANSGLDSLGLELAHDTNPHGILFDGDVSLVARRSITLSTDHIQRIASPEGESATVELSAAYVQFNGTTNPFYDAAVPAYADNLSGTLTVNAGLIDLAGWINFDCTTSNCLGPAYGGFGLLDLRSAGDIRLIAGLNSADTSGLTRSGGFSTGGAIRFDAAQVYVSTGLVGTNPGSVFERDDLDPGFLVRSGQSITIASNGNAATVPLTFGERLTLRAPVIEQAGVLRSPGGQLRLEAVDTMDAEGNPVAGRLVLAPGSLTSTALDGITVPFGVVDPLQDGLFRGYSRADSAPTQSIELNGAAVDMQEGSVLDVSGGGDLVGWAFTSGTGGTRNLLSGTSGDGYFAVAPSFGDAPAPNRPVYEGIAGQTSPFADSRLNVGDTVWLEDVPGLSAGYYTLLPAGYAVLDGALLVRPATNSGQFASPVAAVKRDDGTRIISGYRAVANTGIRDPFWTSFEVMDSATWRQYSAVTTYSFNETKAAQTAAAGIATRTLKDAGTLTIKARDSLDLAGTGLFDAAKGFAGNLEIVAPRIVLANPDSTIPEGYLRVDARQIEALGAGSVLLGGTRPRTTGVPNGLQSSTPIRSGLALTTVATDVQVADGTVFSGGELFLLASDSISIGEGARLTATGMADSFDPSNLLLSGDGALLRLSAGERVGLTRSSGGGSTGTLAIGPGSVLTTEGSLSLDASAGFLLAENAALDVAQLDLATDRINLGATPEGEAGTTLGQATLERLAASADLLLRGYQSIAVFGDVALGERGADGAANLQAITLDTALLRDESADGEGLTLTAGTLTLRNTGGSATTPAAVPQRRPSAAGT